MNHFDRVAAGEHAQGAQDLAVEAGHRGLAGAGVSGEDQVPAQRGRGKARLLAALDHPHQVDQ
jgi:hypothetical protein